MMPQTNRTTSPIASLLGGLAVYAGVALVGVAVLAALFQAGLLSRIDIVFYRGVVLSAVAAVPAAAAGWYLLRRIDHAPLREALALAAFAFGANITFLVLGPVTVDRSISVFVLGLMDKEPDRVWTVPDLEDRFRTLYITDYKQIARRMAEQSTSGNVEARGDGFVITQRGRGFIATAKSMARIFQTDMKFVEPGGAKK